VVTQQSTSCRQLSVQCVCTALFGIVIQRSIFVMRHIVTLALNAICPATTRRVRISRRHQLRSQWLSVGVWNIMYATMKNFADAAMTVTDSSMIPELNIEH